MTPDLSDFDLPEPAEVVPVHLGLRARTFQLRYNEGGPPDLALRVARRADPQPLWRRLAAIGELQQSPLPLPDAMGVVMGEQDAFSLCSWLPGISGDQVLNQGHVPQVLGTVGRVLGVLADQTRDQMADGVLGAEFAPTRPDWTGAWTARVAGLMGEMRHGGVDLGARTEAVATGIEARLLALDGVGPVSVVHGGLRPSRLLFDDRDGGLTLSGLLGLDRALIGDPLVDWAFWVMRAPEALRGVIAGFGQDRARDMLGAPGAAARLEVYWLTSMLEELAATAALGVALDHTERAQRLAACDLAITRFLEGPSVSERVQAALQEGAVAAVEIDQPARTLVAWRQLSDHAVRGALRTPEHTWLWMGGVASVALAAELGEAEAPWLALAEHKLQVLAPGAAGTPEPIDARSLWFADLAGRAMHRYAAERSDGADLAVLASALVVMHGLERGVGDGFLRAVEAAAEGLGHLNADLGLAEPVAEVVQGLLAVWALDQLSLAVNPDTAPVFEQALDRAVAVAGRALSGMDIQAVEGDLNEWLLQGPSDAVARPAGLAEPLLCLALADLQALDALPQSAPALAQALLG